MIERMNALTQYLQLYRDNRNLVEEKSGAAMNALRTEALEWLENTGLPEKGTENYETIDINGLLAPDYGVNLGRLNLSVNARAPFRCGVPHLTPAIFFFKNDIYTVAEGAGDKLPAGLYVNSLTAFCKEYPQVAERYYGKVADIRNPLVSLNTLLAQDGIVIWIKEGVKVDFPLQLVSILENPRPLMAVRRILVIAEPASQVKLLACDHTQSPSVDFLNLQVMEVSVGEKASVEICEMEESSEQTVRLSSLYSRQDMDSDLRITGITLYNGVTRNEYNCAFTGSDAKLTLSGMAIEDKQRSADTFSVVEHAYPRCHTDELFKYVADDESTATFSGLIRVAKGAVQTEAYQNSRNILGNDNARIYSKPRLEIYDDDVKCSHGCAIGQLDETQIFYMRTRGLDEDNARFLLKQAFMSDIIERIGIPDFRLRLHSLVERRFAGGNDSCSSCKGNCIPND